MPRKPRILFDHLPKCGGTSIRDLLISAYGADRVAPFIQFHTVSASLNLFTRYDVLCGHFTRRVLVNPPFPLKTVTVVRDPIDRILSQYDYQREIAAAHTEGRGMSFDEFVRSQHPTIVGAVRNYHCIHFADALRQITSPDQLLPVALEAMARYDLVGLHEDMEETTARLCRLIGVPPRPSPHLNQTGNRRLKGELEPSTLRMLESNNALDMAFYELVCERFHSAAASEPPALAPSLEEEGAEFGVGGVKIANVELEPGATVASGEMLALGFDLLAEHDEPDLVVCVIIKDMFDEYVYGVDTRLLGLTVSIAEGEQRRCQIAIPANLGMGEYRVTLVCYSGAEPASKRYYHWIEEAASFRVLGNVGGAFFGSVKLEAKFSLLLFDRLPKNASRKPG